MEVLNAENGEFLNNYFKLGLTVQLARNVHVCGTALASQKIDLMTKDALEFLRNMESQRINIETSDRKKNWDNLSLEELKLAAKIFLRAPYPDTKDGLSAALARQQEACPPGILSNSLAPKTDLFGFDAPPSSGKLHLKRTASHSKELSFSRRRQRELGKGRPHSPSRSRSRSHSHSRRQYRSRSNSPRRETKVILPQQSSSSSNPSTSTSSSSSSISHSTMSDPLLSQTRESRSRSRSHSRKSYSRKSRSRSSSISPGRSSSYINFGLSKKVVKKIREGLLVRLYELHGDSPFTVSDPKRRASPPKSFQEWYRLFRKLVKVREFYVPDTRESNALYVDHIEGLFDTHEPIGVLIYDDHYRQEVERYNGAFYPEPPAWTTKSIHLLTSHVKKFTSCPTCKTSEHPGALCPIRANYFVPDSSRVFSKGAGYKKFSKTSGRLRPQREQNTLSLTSSSNTSASSSSKKGVCAYFNRKRGCLKGNSCSFSHSCDKCGDTSGAHGTSSCKSSPQH